MQLVANSKSPPERIVNKSGLAAFFGMSVPTVDAWIRRNCPCVSRGARGKQWEFDILEVAKWRYGGEQSSDEDDPEKMQPKDRLDWYKGDRERDHRDKEQDLLIPFDLEEQLIGAAFAAVRASLMSQHNSIAAQYPEIPADAIRWIHAANRELLTRLSETRIPESIAGALDALTVESGAAAGSDGKPMG